MIDATKKALDKALKETPWLKQVSVEVHGLLHRKIRVTAKVSGVSHDCAKAVIKTYIFGGVPELNRDELEVVCVKTRQNGLSPSSVWLDEMATFQEKDRKRSFQAEFGPWPQDALEHAKRASAIARGASWAHIKLPDDTLASMFKPIEYPNAESFQAQLARVFGLSPDAPDDVLLATAEKAWAGSNKQVEGLKRDAAELRTRVNSYISLATSRADECGRLKRESAMLRARVGQLLLELEEAKR